MNQPSLPMYPPADEIDLLDLMAGLWRQKILIIAATVSVIAVALAYVLLAAAEYEAQSKLRPAYAKDLDELNSTEIYELTPEAALRKVGAALESYETRKSFFEANRELFKGLEAEGRPLDQVFREFNEGRFKLLQPDPKKPNNLSDFVGVRLLYPESIDGVAIVNGLVEHAIELERQRIAADFDGVLANRLAVLERKTNAARASYEADKASKIAQLAEADSLKRAKLRDELKALRQHSRTRRLNRIAQLDEAIRIADSLGIRKPTTPTALGDAGREGGGNVIRTEVNNQQIPLYFMGTEALEAERKVLQQRRSDDFTEPRMAEIAKELQLLEHNRQIEVLEAREQEDLFLVELAKYKEEESRLKAMKLDLSGLKLVRVDEVAVQSDRPAKPKKLMILAVAGVLGLMLGVFVALIRWVLNRRA
ncbi:Wzz/FepE/Etk N-terminal domain-containing protein [Pseudomonas sp. CAU 1711]|uniref:Wzz/FepE/Etk N-terminal domain-containing protein n=1 Tax=Pseudomonas sp. CAU 1711 TaxID=3140356 RepID=UPI003260B327